MNSEMNLLQVIHKEEKENRLRQKKTVSEFYFIQYVREYHNIKNKFILKELNAKKNEKNQSRTGRKSNWKGST